MNSDDDDEDGKAGDSSWASDSSQWESARDDGDESDEAETRAGKDASFFVVECPPLTITPAVVALMTASGDGGEAPKKKGKQQAAGRGGASAVAGADVSVQSLPTRWMLGNLDLTKGISLRFERCILRLPRMPVASSQADAVRTLASIAYLPRGPARYDLVSRA